MIVSKARASICNRTRLFTIACLEEIKDALVGGSIAHWLAYLLLDPAALSSIPSILKRISEEEIFDFAEVNQQRGLEVNWSVALKMLNEYIYYWLVAS